MREGKVVEILSTLRSAYSTLKRKKKKKGLKREGAHFPGGSFSGIIDGNETRIP